MKHLFQNKNINTLIVSVLRCQQVQEMLKKSIKITYGILFSFSQTFDTDDDPVKQIIPCFPILLKKVKMRLPTSSKNTLIDYIQISHKKEKIKACWACGCFLLKSRITTYTYSSFKNKISFNNQSILEIHDYFRFR